MFCLFAGDLQKIEGENASAVILFSLFVSLRDDVSVSLVSRSNTVVTCAVLAS